MSGVPRSFSASRRIFKASTVCTTILYSNRAPLFDLAVVNLMHREVASGKKVSHVLFAHHLVLGKTQR